MTIAATSLLKDKAITILAALFYSLFYFIDLIEFGFTVSLCSLQYLYVLSSICTLSFSSHINPDQLSPIIFWKEMYIAPIMLGSNHYLSQTIKTIHIKNEFSKN